VTGNFLGEPPLTPEAQALYDEDVAEDGYVGNGARLWAYQPQAVRELFALMSRAYRASGLTFRQCATLVAATAATLGDSEQDRALAEWARKVVRDPNATTPADVQALRDCGLDDGQIFAVTTYIALLLAFSTMNDALGLLPDAQLVQSLPSAVLDAVTWGRRAADDA
jgi:hypothetical protein